MKKLVYYILTCILLLSVLPVSAQKRKYGRKKVVKVEVPVENPRFTEMLSSTQKVIIIDSVIVGKDALLTAFYTNPEEGRLATYKDFFQSQEQPNGYVYVNELGNKCFFSMTDANGARTAKRPRRRRTYQHELSLPDARRTDTLFRSMQW